MKHTDGDGCICASCCAKALQMKRKGHPYLPTSLVWVRAFGLWHPGRVAKIAVKNVHVRYEWKGEERVLPVDPCSPNPAIQPRTVPFEELPR